MAGTGEGGAPGRVIRYFLKKAPLQPVSAITGEGIAGLKQLIDRVTDEIPARDREPPFRMPLDRSFSSRLWHHCYRVP